MPDHLIQVDKMIQVAHRRITDGGTVLSVGDHKGPPYPSPPPSPLRILMGFSLDRCLLDAAKVAHDSVGAGVV